MKIQTLKFKYKKEMKEMQVGVPESIPEAVKVLGAEAALQDLVFGYLHRSKREFLGLKKRTRNKVKIDLRSLTEAQIAVLRQNGLI